jgi:hypothetical protein
MLLVVGNEWILQELKWLISITQSSSLWFGPRGLTSTSFSSDNQIELAQVQVQVGDITSVLFVMTHCTGCDNDYVDEEGRPHFQWATGKALCVYNKLNSSSSGLQMLLKKFDGEFPVSHISKKKQHTSFRNYGITNPPSNF